MLFFFRRTGEQHQSPEDEKQINKTFLSKYDESDKEDEEQSSTTEPTVRENIKYEQRTEKDTDEDASFSENEQILSKSSMSDEQQQQQQTTEESRLSSIIGTNEIQDDHEIISKTTESSINVSKSQLPSTELQEKQPETKSKDIPEESIQSITVPETEIVSSTMDENSALNNETDPDLQSFLNTLTTHLLPDLRTSFNEETTEDEHPFISETKSTPKEDPSNQIETVVETK
jgi:hypothetical protein